MKVTLNMGRIHSVSIQGDFTGPYIDLEISPAAAYQLLRGLEAKRSQLLDMTQNYYDCSDCAQTHHKSVKTCPNVMED